MTDLQAALGLSQLGVLRKSWPNGCLLQCTGFVVTLPAQLLKVSEDVLSSVHLAVIRLTQATSAQHRDVFEGLRASGIGVQLHYSPVHLQPYYRRLGFHEGAFPNAEKYAEEAITLPLFPGLSYDDISRITHCWEPYIDNAITCLELLIWLYGATNTSRVSEHNVSNILSTANSANVKHLDTAQSYGNAEPF